MKSLLLLAASALALSACTPSAKPPQRAKLDCPETQGDLARASVAADGKSCVYRDGGTDIELRLVALTGTVDQTLEGVERSLLTDPDASKTASTALDTAARAVAAEAAAAAKTAADDARWEGSESRAGSNDGDEVSIDLPGVQIEANDDSAQVSIAGMHINATDGEAVIRRRDTVRLKGESLSREKRGVRASFIRTGKDLPGGWRYVGYEAAGPRTGPITVAVIRSRSEHGKISGLEGDLTRLVRRNGGV